jgi:CubicO group peptidase (beta-lactamase class C family)
LEDVLSPGILDLDGRVQALGLGPDVVLPSVAVARGDRILWEEGFGWADREDRRRATPHTPYPLGSISKPITATALMVLVERKLLALDKPINDYLGDVKVRARVGDAS